MASTSTSAGVQNNFGVLDLITAKIQTFVDSVYFYLNEPKDLASTAVNNEKTAPSVKQNYSATDFSNVSKTRSSTATPAHSQLPKTDDFYHMFKIKDVDVPCCIREPYITSGYMLPNQPLRYYLKVIYFPSNELLNVWTHLLPAIYFAWLLYKFSVEFDPWKTWPLLVMTSAAMTVLFCSAFAHTFHAKSAHFHRCCFTLDYYGISVFAYASTVMKFLVCSEANFFQTFASFNLLVLTVNTLIGFACCCITQLGGMFSSVETGRKLKVLCNFIGYMYGSLPVFARLYVFGYDDDPGIMYLIWEFVFILVCPFWYFSDLPQKIWPGKFDFIGHSHQIFHICSACGCYCMVNAVYCDVTHPDGTWSKLLNMERYPDFYDFSLYAASLLSSMIVLGVFVVKKSKEMESDCLPSEQNKSSEKLD